MNLDIFGGTIYKQQTHLIKVFQHFVWQLQFCKQPFSTPQRSSLKLTIAPFTFLQCCPTSTCFIRDCSVTSLCHTDSYLPLILNLPHNSLTYNNDDSCNRLYITWLGHYILKSLMEQHSHRYNQLHHGVITTFTQVQLRCPRTNGHSSFFTKQQNLIKPSLTLIVEQIYFSKFISY